MCHIFTVFSRPPIYFFLYIFTKLSLLFIFAFEFKLVQHIEYLALRSWIRLLGVHVYHHQKLLSITQQPLSIGLFALSRPHFLLCLHYVLDFNLISIWLKKLELGLIVSVFWLQTESLYIHVFNLFNMKLRWCLIFLTLAHKHIIRAPFFWLQNILAIQMSALLH